MDNHRVQPQYNPHGLRLRDGSDSSMVSVPKYLDKSTHLVNAFGEALGLLRRLPGQSAAPYSETTNSGLSKSSDLGVDYNKGVTFHGTEYHRVDKSSKRNPDQQLKYSHNLVQEISDKVHQSSEDESTPQLNLESASTDVFSDISKSMLDLQSQAKATEKNGNEDPHLESQPLQVGFDQVSEFNDSKGVTITQESKGDDFNNRGSDAEDVQRKDSNSCLADSSGDAEDEPGEVDLEDVIGQAFRSIIEPTSAPNQEEDSLEAELAEESEESASAVSDSCHPLTEPTKSTELDETALDLEGIVQNVVQKMARENASASPSEENPVIEQSTSSTSEEVTARQTNQSAVQSLGDNVLQHFQLNASQECPTFKNSIDPDSSEAQELFDKDELEKLQMNEILQNAFNMAMQNSHEVLTEEASSDAADSSRTENEAAEASTANAVAVLATETLNEKRTLVPSDGRDIYTQRSSDLDATKSLSIAETLALQRANMADNKEGLDLSSINKSLQNERATSIHPQLSSILSSLSLHIKSGTQSQNLMLVIRQMTNSLMLNKHFSMNLNPAVLRVLSEMSPEEKATIADILKQTQSFLTKRNSDEVPGALTLVSNVLVLLEPSASLIQVVETGISGKTEPTEGDVADFFDQAYSTLSVFSILRLGKVLSGAKPDMDSEEYKERIRVENRERKKRWREENAERNKDNDLRLRVIKRAVNMFGDGQLPEKRAWIEEEFIRRREKRFIRKKLEESSVKRIAPPPQGSSMDANADQDSAADYASLGRRLNEIFNLITQCGTGIDSAAVVTATSAAIAVTTSLYSGCSEVPGAKPPLVAMTEVLNSILESNVRSGSYKRIPFLYDDPLKINSGQDLYRAKPVPLTPVNDALSLRSTAFNRESVKELLKRLGSDFYTTDFKRSRIDDDTLNSGPLDSVNAQYTTSKDQDQTTSSSRLRDASSALKMPQYKRQIDSLANGDLMANAPSRPLNLSPFLSNKTSFDSNGGVVPGLKRPGLFQKPAIKGIEKKPVSFPTFYSSMFLKN